MRSSLPRKPKLPVKHSLEHGGHEPPYCLRSIKRHKVSASPQSPTYIGEIASELHTPCIARATPVETAFKNLKPGPSNLPVKVSPIDLKSLSMKPLVLQSKASSINVEMGSPRVLEKIELCNEGNNSVVPKHIDILCSSYTSCMPCIHPRKNPPPKIRKGVTIFREFPQGGRRRNLDLFSKSDGSPDGKSSEEKKNKIPAEKEQIGGRSCDIGRGFARIEGKILEDIKDKGKAEVYHSEFKLNQDAGSDTITNASPQNTSLQANASSKMTCNNNDEVKSWVERYENDPDEYSMYNFADVSNSVVMQSVMNEYVDIAHPDGGKSVGQQGVKTSDFAAATGATVGYSDKIYELMGHEGSYYMLRKHNGTKFDDVETATQKGVKALGHAAATCATDGCSDKVYELMGHKGSYYMLLKHEDTIFNDGTSAAQASQEGVKASDSTAATVATDGCSDNRYELMGHKGSYYLLVIHNDTNFHAPYVEADMHNLEAGLHNMEAVSDRKHNSTLSEKQSINLTVNSNQEALCRSKVREVLNLFQKTLKNRLLKNQVTRQSNGETKTISSHVYEVATLLRQQKEWIYMNEQVLGAIPGVEVGDQFQYRAELVIVRVHVQFVADIDYMEKDGKKIATSMVFTHCYSNDEELTDVIDFCGSDKETLAEQNLKYQTPVQDIHALKNSMDEETPVRVTRCHQSPEGNSTTYAYDGLYIVSKFWQKKGKNGKLVDMFQLKRMQGQPKLKVNKLGKYGKSKARYYRTLMDDISYEKEKISIPVVNDIDHDKPPTFNYITKMVYPKLKKSVNARGCHCINGCSDDVQCSCVVKNGGTVPFNEDGALIRAKPIVYECGPSCKCPPSCINRVSQHGIKLQLEVFKTKTRGWGIRSRNFISSGSFICEYVGELLDDKQAEERIGFDEYLFDIGDEDGFAIDGAKIGNIGRFVNHSCSPNLYAQDVLFDHNDKMMPHVMLFATKNIYPLQEVTYNYNYKVGHVFDSNGNVKEKTCHCGAPKCTGRMY